MALRFSLSYSGPANALGPGFLEHATKVSMLTIFASSLGILNVDTASAYPFEANPRSFATWASQVTYTDGFKSNRRFYDFSNCRFWSRGGYEYAKCTGYYTETTRLGVSKRCVSDHIYYQRQISPSPGNIVISTEYTNGAPAAECVPN